MKPHDALQFAVPDLDAPELDPDDLERFADVLSHLAHYARLRAAAIPGPGDYRHQIELTFSRLPAWADFRRGAAADRRRTAFEDAAEAAATDRVRNVTAAMDTEQAAGDERHKPAIPTNPDSGGINP